MDFVRKVSGIILLLVAVWVGFWAAHNYMPPDWRFAPILVTTLLGVVLGISTYFSDYD